MHRMEFSCCCTFSISSTHCTCIVEVGNTGVSNSDGVLRYLGYGTMRGVAVFGAALRSSGRSCTIAQTWYPMTVLHAFGESCAKVMGSVDVWRLGYFSTSKSWNGRWAMFVVLSSVLATVIPRNLSEPCDSFVLRIAFAPHTLASVPLGLLPETIHTVQFFLFTARPAYADCPCILSHDGSLKA